VNTNAANGTYYGGQIGVQQDRLKQGTADQYGDVQRNLDAPSPGSVVPAFFAATGSTF